MTTSRDAKDRFEPDEHGLDELVVHNCFVHIERMSRGQIWIGIDKEGKHLSLMLYTQYDKTIKVNDQDGNLAEFFK